MSANSPFPKTDRWFFCAVLWAILGAASLGITGCKWPAWNWKGDNFHDDMAHWGEQQRPADQPDGGSSEMLGVSAKSQQIERNLGVR